MIPWFSDILGQDDIVAYLQRSVAKGEVPHALMLIEQDGGEGMPLALALSRELHLKSLADSANAKEQERSTNIQIDALAHPDLYFLFPIVKQDKMESCDDYMPTFRKMLQEQDGRLIYSQWIESLKLKNTQLSIPVTEAEALEAKLQYKPYSSNVITVICCLPEKMHVATANKLLKLIEEPPEGVYFIFVCRQVHLLLPTIISRVQSIYCHLLSEELIADILIKEHGVSTNAAKRLAHLSQGNLTQAKILLRDEENISPELSLAYRLLTHPLRGTLKEQKSFAEELHALPREELTCLCKTIASVVREAFICHVVKDNRSPLLYTLEKKNSELTTISMYINEENIEAIQKEIGDISVELAQNVSAKIVFFDFMLKLARWYNA